MGYTNKHYVEEQFFSMPDNNSVHPSQIPIRRERLTYLLRQYYPKKEQSWVLFRHPGHFIIYNNVTKGCIFDASYILLREEHQQMDEDPIAAVITRIRINEDEILSYGAEKDSFMLLADILLKEL